MLRNIGKREREYLDPLRGSERERAILAVNYTRKVKAIPDRMVLDEVTEPDKLWKIWKHKTIQRITLV